MAVFAFQNLLAYDDQTTHPALTDEIVDFYNLLHVDAPLTAEQKEWVVEGAMFEDTPPRWINHFYDPIRKNGWSGEHTGWLWEEFMQDTSYWMLAQFEPVSSLNWLHNRSLQKSYSLYGGDQTWDRAVEEYRKGNEKEAYRVLGHILHLIEDASVPDHTRNDTHAHELRWVTRDYGSPYEEYSKQYNRQTIKQLRIIEALWKDGNRPPQFATVDDYLISLAKYSNGYFFSKDTIYDSKYQFPRIAKENGNFGYGIDESKNEFPLARVEYIKKGGEIKKIYTLKDKSEEYILNAYFSRLSRQAVLHGVGVIDLFHKQANDSNVKIGGTSWITPPVVSITGEGYRVWNFLSSVVSAVGEAFSFFANSLTAQLAGLIPINAQPQPQVETITQSAPALALVPVIEAPVAVNEPQQVVVQQEVAPVSQLPQEAEVVPSGQLVITEPQYPIATTAPVDNAVLVVAPIIEDLLLPTPVYRGSGSVTGVSPDALLAQNQPAPAAEAQPQTQVENVDTFATSTEDVFTETETAATTDDVATSTDDIFATSTDPVIADATSTEPIISTITDFTDSIVINEVAWMGTKAQANDEWIELYNKTDYDIDLSGWTLESRYKRFSISLENVIPAKGYFLLERTASTTTDVAEHMVYTGALNNDGPDANLYLKNGTTTIDAVDFNKWPAGDNGKRYSMERVSAYATSTYATNWKSYGDPDAVPYAKDAKGDDIFGTPGRKNSVSGFYTPTGNIMQDTTWEKAHSPYFVSSTIIISSGATLTIEPGVVVKFTKGIPSGGGKIDVRGILHAEGAVEEMITFTSLLDDAADSIDSNRDGAATSPAPGDWHNIVFSNTETESAVRYAHVRYGGLGINYNPSAFSPTYTGVLSMQGGSVEISDSIIEDSSAIAVYIDKGAAPKIQRTTILNTAQNTYSGVQPYGVGIFIVADASAEIIGNTLTNNTIGIQSASITDAPVIVKDNRFDGNTKNGEFVKGYLNWNLDNSGNEDVNHKGGFDIQFTVLDGQAKTIHADTMPYIIGGGAQVLAGGSLAIEPGAVFKFSKFSSGADVTFSIKGTLSASGTEEKPIVFTAFADDGDGYDSNISDVAPVAGAWKYIAFSGATSSDSALEHIVVRYGGQGKDMCPYGVIAGPCMEYYGAMRIDGADPTLRRITLENNLGIALFTEGAANPTIENSLIRDTQEAIKTSTTTIGGYGISIGPESQPILTDNTYANNAEDVVYRE